jgi:RNA polymerase sigma factor (sigma-70 family)
VDGVDLVDSIQNRLMSRLAQRERPLSPLGLLRPLSPTPRTTRPNRLASSKTYPLGLLHTPFMEEAFLVTRRSLVQRLSNLEDHRIWQEFFETYWRLIYSVARKAGLDAFEAEEAVQETVISVVRKIPEFRYDPDIGSFRGWLLTLAKWRIADQFRKRQSKEAIDLEEGLIEQPWFTEAWNQEWENHLLTASLERLKQKTSLSQFQVFECYVIKGWPARKVAKELQVSVGSVYLAKNRLLPILKEIMARVEKGEHEPTRT